jgi:hypothetical protein
MALTLGAKQEIFAGLLPQLITRAYELGFRVRLKELLRAPEQAEYNATHCGTCKKRAAAHSGKGHDFHAIGIRNSLHCEGLALDLVLFRDGRPLWATERYRELGEYWESLHELTYWGGRTGKIGDRLRRDGGHFAMTHRGRQ